MQGSGLPNDLQGGFFFSFFLIKTIILQNSLRIKIRIAVLFFPLHISLRLFLINRQISRAVHDCCWVELHRKLRGEIWSTNCNYREWILARKLWILTLLIKYDIDQINISKKHYYYRAITFIWIQLLEENRCIVMLL